MFYAPPRPLTHNIGWVTPLTDQQAQRLVACDARVALPRMPDDRITGYGQKDLNLLIQAGYTCTPGTPLPSPGSAGTGPGWG